MQKHISSILLIGVLLFGCLNQPPSTTGLVVGNASKPAVHYCQVAEPYNASECSKLEEAARDCVTRDLAYAVDNFSFKSECTTSLEYCVDSECKQKTSACVESTATCQFYLKNTDTNEGLWKFNVAFIKAGKEIQSNPQSLRAEPGGEYMLAWYLKTQGSADAPTDANLTTNCKIIESQVPTKQICYDVSCRNVTKYRAVTKPC